MKKVIISRNAPDLEKIRAISDALNIFFKDKQGGPYEMLGRLLEESGEVATEVNRLEANGIKQDKGDASVTKLCDEAVDVIKVIMQIVAHYEATEELSAAIDRELKVAVDHNVAEYSD